jgi:elongation factor 1-alpha
VSRHLASIQTLRDRCSNLALLLSLTFLCRTLPIATSLLSTDLSLQRTPVGLVVEVHHPQTGKSSKLEWSAEQSSSLSSAEVELSLVERIQSALQTEQLSALPSSSLSLVEHKQTSSDRYFDSHTQHLQQMFDSDSGGLDAKPLTFPCILLRAHFDPFTIVRNSSLFNTIALFPAPLTVRAPVAGARSEFYQLRYPVYCLEDIWDLLCYSSNQYFPGQDLPLLVSTEGSTASTLSSLRDQTPSPQGAPNMVVALGHTPLLFNLYVERSCLYQSCLNITGDLMAYASTTYQWAKLFYDCVYSVAHLESSLANSKPKKTESVEETWSPEERAEMALAWKKTHLEVGLMALVSYSYACEFRRTYPSESTVYEMFGQSLLTPEAGADPPSAGHPFKFFSRDSFPGLTGPLGLATLLASTELYSFSRDPLTWNSLVLTLFSRFCEAISGGKVIRSNNPLVTDLREQEEPYRLLIGQIQSTLQRRLAIDWPKLELAEKLHLISLCSTELVTILRTLVTSFLEGFDRYGLPLWSEIVLVLQSCLSLQRVGISSLREMYLRFDQRLDSVIDSLLITLSGTATGEGAPTKLLLPVVKIQPATSDGGVSLVLTELDASSDPMGLLGFIEAILATKVSPKLEYKPVLKAEYPSIATDLNRQLHVSSLLSSWNTDNPALSIGLIGNVNSGKSTLSGRILYDLGLVDKRLVDKLSEEVKRLGYTTELKYAWILDRLREERARNVTLIPKFAAFQTPQRRYTLIDNPGHKDFLKNITAGIFRSDVALLVVSGVETERTVSGLVNNFVEEYLVNAFCYSIKHLLVLVNKMDAIGYAEAEFHTACESVKKALKKAGYKTSGANKNIQFIPLSGLTGEGILSTSVHMPWYQGPCLLQLLDEIVIPKRLSQKPLRMVVSETHKIPGVGTVLCGKVECGTLTVGDTLSCSPDPGDASARKASTSKARGGKASSSSASHTFTVKSIESHRLSQPSASAGEEIGIAISGGSGITVKSFTKGMLLTLSSNPRPPVFTRFEAQLIILKTCTIRCGYAPTLLINSNIVPVKVTRLVSLIDKNNAVLETSPEAVTQSQICICEMEAMKPFAAETIHDFPKLSKFLIREHRQTVAIGFIRGTIA